MYRTVAAAASEVRSFFVHRLFVLVGVNQHVARDSRAALCRMHVYIGARQSLIKGLLISWYPLSHYAGTRYIPFFIMLWARSRSLGMQSVHALGRFWAAEAG